MMEDSGDEARRNRKKKPRARREYALREPRPIDAAQLQELALDYAARYSTTAAKLRRYLQRKLGERVWTPAEPADIESLVQRLVALGYIDDRAYAASKQRDLTARGFGAGRVRGALSAAGVSRDDVAAVLAPDDDTPADPYARAIAFARRRRFGPFAREAGFDPARRNGRANALHAFRGAARCRGATHDKSNMPTTTTNNRLCYSQVLHPLSPL